MPSFEAIPGRCAAPIPGGGFCDLEPFKPLGEQDKLKCTRCVHHGGLEQYEASARAYKKPATAKALSVTGGLYSRLLRSTLKTAEAQAIFDDPDTVKLDLKPEIAIWRAKLYDLHRLEAEGKKFFQHAEGTPPVLVDFLIRESQLILNRLIRLQYELHPNESSTGELVINIRVSGEAKAAAVKVDMPDLEADGERTDDSETPLPDSGAEGRPALNHPLEGLDNE